jgi:multiple sugar transport system ATP-binding protein
MHIRSQAVDALVDVTEMVGNEKLLYVKSGGHDYLARVDPRSRARLGQQMQLLFDLDRIHLFRADDEKAIDKIEIEAEEVPGVN